MLSEKDKPTAGCASKQDWQQKATIMIIQEILLGLG